MKGKILVTGGTGYIRGNTPGVGGKEVFSITPGPDTDGAHDVKSNLTLIRDAHYGTGQRQAQAQ